MADAAGQIFVLLVGHLAAHTLADELGGAHTLTENHTHGVQRVRVTHVGTAAVEVPRVPVGGQTGVQKGCQHISQRVIVVIVVLALTGACLLLQFKRQVEFLPALPEHNSLGP